MSFFSGLLYLLLKLIIAFFVLKFYIFIAYKIIDLIDSKKKNKEGDNKNV